MVQLMKNKSGNPETPSYRGRHSPVKLEIMEDPLEEAYGPYNKRAKPSPSLPQEQLSALNETAPCPPLGLHLRKSPSLLELIQRKLTDKSMFCKNVPNGNLSSEVIRETRGAAASGTTEKIKASNFQVSILKIGSWEYKSRHVGDLVGKCYFAKHKLVWEVLEGGLKSKIEIHWSDIMALKACCPEIGPSTLTVVLARQPLFFRETNPQPRKHTLWQATTDFTDGQASKYRMHFLLCEQGLLAKHFEKLIHCDTRLNILSQQQLIISDSHSLQFDTEPSAFEHTDNPKDPYLHQINHKRSSTTEHSDPPGMTLDGFPLDQLSPSSVMDCPSNDGSPSSETDCQDPRKEVQIKPPGLRHFEPVEDFASQLELFLSEPEEVTSGSPPFSNDDQVVAEQNLHVTEDRIVEGSDDGNNVKPFEENSRDASGSKQAQGMFRQDSFYDIIQSLLVNMYEEGGDSIDR